jgi:hypothetical protein
MAPERDEHNVALRAQPRTSFTELPGSPTLGVRDLLVEFLIVPVLWGQQNTWLSEGYNLALNHAESTALDICQQRGLESRRTQSAHVHDEDTHDLLDIHFLDTTMCRCNSTRTSAIRTFISSVYSYRML